MTVYYKMRQLVLLQNAAAIDDFVTKYESYYKMRRLLQIATVRLVKF